MSMAPVGGRSFLGSAANQGRVPSIDPAGLLAGRPLITECVIRSPGGHVAYQSDSEQRSKPGPEGGRAVGPIGGSQVARRSRTPAQGKRLSQTVARSCNGPHTEAVADAASASIPGSSNSAAVRDLGPCPEPGSALQVWARVYYGRTIPEPTVTVGRRHMYSAEDFERILKFLGVEERVCG